VYIQGASGSVNNIATWNGSFWLALGSGGNGVNDTVRALAVGGSGELYAGGDFTFAAPLISANHVAEWTGGAWLAFGDGADPVGNGTNAPVYALTWSSAGLYVGGAFMSVYVSGASGIANFVALWNGS